MKGTGKRPLLRVCLHLRLSKKNSACEEFVCRLHQRTENQRQKIVTLLNFLPVSTYSNKIFSTILLAMDGHKNQQSQVVLPEPPEDSISSVKFLPGSNNMLLASSWDGFLRVYNVQDKSCVFTSEENHPLLDCAASVSIFLRVLIQNISYLVVVVINVFWQSDYAFYGGLDCAIYTMDLETQKCKFFLDPNVVFDKIYLFD